jgi:hypothetical protein
VTQGFPFVEITRSASHKVARQISTGDWISDEFSCHVKTQCLASEAEQKSEETHIFCKVEVARAFEELRLTMPPDAERVADSSDAAFQGQARRNREADEESPFRVTAAPKGETIGIAFEPPVHITETKAFEPETIAPVQTGIAVVPDAPRRGRKPKPEGPAAMEALKASAPPERSAAPVQAAPERLRPEPDKQGFKATEDDLPSNIAAAPHEPGKPVQSPEELPKSQADRLRAIESRLIREHHPFIQAQVVKNKEKGIITTTEKIVTGLLKVFVKSFLRVKELPKPPDPLYETHLLHWESFAASYGGQLLSKAAEEGEKAGDSWRLFVRRIDAWPKGFKNLAAETAIKYYPDEVMNLIEFLEQDGLTEPGEDMFAFLLLLRISRNALLAVRKAAVERKCSLVDVVGQLDFDAADEKAVLSAVAGA